MISPPLSSKQLLKLARSFHTKKKLGQHFLVSEEVLSSIVNALELSPEDEVLEIGPGIGFLTRVLCAAAKSVVAVELDRESIETLKELKLENLSIKHGDFLAYDISSARFREPGSTGWTQLPRERKLKVVGNVPYQITGLILAHLLGEVGQPQAHLADIDCIVLTIQKEVAERMVARPGSKSYSRLTLLVSYFCKAEYLLDVNADKFFPPPRVDSAVVKLVPLDAPPVTCNNLTLMRRVIKSGFAQRRKMLRNALTSLGIDLAELNQLFKELKFDPQVRAESLSLHQFAMPTVLTPKVFEV